MIQFIYKQTICFQKRTDQLSNILPDWFMKIYLIQFYLQFLAFFLNQDLIKFKYFKQGKMPHHLTLIFSNLIKQDKMQQAIVRKENFNDEQLKEKNAFRPIKNKSSILKKKKMSPAKLYLNIDLNHAININDICFINQKSLRDPQNSEQTLLKTLFYYKMISKVTLNSSFINLQLKKNSDNQLPPEYFFERLRSLGDRQMADIALHLENIHKQFSRIKEESSVEKVQFDSSRENTLLKNFLQKMEGKMFYLYYSEVTPERTNMRNIIFSIPLLKALGCDLKNIAMEFLKYKHVFFEVFTAKNYRNFLLKCLQNYGKIIEAQSNPDYELSEKEKQELSMIIYDDEVIRKKQGPEGIYEEVIDAKVKWFAPHPSISCFQVLEIYPSEATRLPKKRRITNHEETDPEEQLRELKKIGIDQHLLQIQEPAGQKNIQERSKNKKASVQSYVKVNQLNGCIASKKDP